jgi:hypothetical protein
MYEPVKHRAVKYKTAKHGEAKHDSSEGSGRIQHAAA